MIDKQKYFVIGHITSDLIITPTGISNRTQLGGSVYYCAVAAQKLGLEAHIITRCKINHPYVHQITKMGITVHCLPPKDKENKSLITSFTNKYDHRGRRTQTVNNIQESITSNDLKQLLAIISKDSIIHLAPVMSEVEGKLVKLLKNRGFLVVTPQGYFRHRQKNGQVKQKPWKQIRYLTDADAVIISTEDITFDKIVDEDTIDRLKKSPLFILTKQREGSVIYEKGKTPLEIPAFHLEKHEELDFTGCGDVFAVVFAIDYYRNKNLKKAGNLASLFAAKQISNP